MSSNKRGRSTGTSSSRAAKGKRALTAEEVLREEQEENPLHVANAKQDWKWLDAKDDPIGQQWKDDQNRRLSSFKDIRVERRLWRFKMADAASGVTGLCVYERPVNVEEFSQINIMQKFDELGWRAALTWCQDARKEIYLAAICEWFSTLQLDRGDGRAKNWKLIGDIWGKKMIMSFETMKRIADFDSLGANNYQYRKMSEFLDNSVLQNDPSGMIEEVIPFMSGTQYQRNDMSVEGKILQNINLENIFVRLGDRGKVRVHDCRILISLLRGSPKLSFMRIVMMNVWDTRESYQRKMIPYVRLINELIVQQKCLPKDALWVESPIEAFDINKLKKSRIIHSMVGKNHILFDNATRRILTVRDPDAVDEEEAERLYDEGDEGNEADREGPSQSRVQTRRPPRGFDIDGETAMYVARCRPAGYESWTHGNRMTYDNISRMRFETQRREEQEIRRWRALAVAHEVNINNQFIFQEQQRHHQDLIAGRPYQEFAPWVDYSTIRDRIPPPDQPFYPPQGVASSYIPLSQNPQPMQNPLDDYHEMWASLMELPYQPYPPPQQDDHYQR